VALAEAGLDGRPGVAFYCAITRERAKSIMWGPLKALNEEHQLGLKMNDSELIAYGPGGGRIQVTGADKMKEAEKKRGDAYKIAIVDEAGLFEGYLAEMFDQVIKPGLMDYNAPFWLLGTPNPSCLGFFHDAAVELKGWERFHWTARENPYIDWDAVIQPEIAERGLSVDDPAFMREYLGLWVKGGASTLYKYNEDLNSYVELPEAKWQYTIGVDLGYNDPTAFCVGAYSRSVPEFYAIEMWKRSGMVQEEVGSALMKLVETYPNPRIVIDQGGLGKMIGEGLKLRYPSLHIEPTKKTDKMAHIEFLNSDLKMGKVKLRKDAPVIEQWAALHVTDDGREDPTVPNDLADALLYCWRDARQFMYRAPKLVDPSIDTWEQELLNQDKRTENERRWRQPPGRRAWSKV
jgi:hypothetical protein